MSQFLQILPLEVIELVIDYLHDDIYTLKSCSLVCKAWLTRTRHHLFTAIHLDLSLPPKSLDMFLRHIAEPKSYFHVTVRRLYLRSEAVPQRQYDLMVLSSLRSLTHISLSYWYSNIPDPRWFRGSPKVTYLEFASCRIDYLSFAALLRQLPNIEVLKFSNVSWMNHFDVEQCGQCGGILQHLRELHLGPHSSSIIPALSALITKQIIGGKVREIQLEDVEIRYEMLAGNLLVAVGPSLRSLVVSATNRLSHGAQAFALHRNTNLKTIHFTNLVDPVHGASLSHEFSFDWVIGLLRKAPDSIEEIMFSFWLIPGDTLGLHTTRRASINWPSLERVISRFSQLTRIDLRIGAGNEHCQWIRKTCKRRFPQWSQILMVSRIEV